MEQYLNKTLTIDPGDHTGWSYWKKDLYPIYGQYNLDRKYKTLEEQLKYLADEFSNLLERFPNTSYVYIEGVEFWEGSQISMVAAKRQNLSKLSYLVGMYFDKAITSGMEARIIPARVWKGQMTNEILENKIRRINGQSYPSEHILNAVGIGISRMGYFQRTVRVPQKFHRNKLGFLTDDKT